VIVTTVSDVRTTAVTGILSRTSAFHPVPSDCAESRPLMMSWRISSKTGGAEDGETDAEGLTEGLSDPEGLIDGLSDPEGLTEGDSDPEGLTDGDSDPEGETEGLSDGLGDGLSEPDGETEGDSEEDPTKTDLKQTATAQPSSLLQT
jgi:hypothetical protein